ncbi:hypothetical protein AB4K20DRAFT_1987196, partial [Rhizopus microsporus]
HSLCNSSNLLATITTLPTGLIWLLRTSFRRSYPKHTLRLEATSSVLEEGHSG